MTARFEGMGPYAESEQSFRLQVRGAAPAHTVASRALESVSDRLPLFLAAVLAGIWSTFGYALYQVSRIR